MPLRDATEYVQPLRAREVAEYLLRLRQPDILVLVAIARPPGAADGLGRLETEGQRQAYREFYDRFYEQTERRLHETDAGLAEYRRLSQPK